VRRRFWLSAALVTVAALSVVTVPAVAAPAPPAPPGAGITLLTGDHVSVEGDRARVRPGGGRERVSFRQYRDERGDLHVVPSDVERRLSARELDRRLFNVSELVRSGYDDASSPAIPLIVQGVSAVALSGGQALPSIGGVAVKADKSASFLTGLQTAGAGRIWLDGRVKASLDKSVPQIGAPQAWQAGNTGKDTTVAVLDTGIDATHPDLAGAVIEAKDFTGSASGADDRNGHGTHVAATVTGEGRYRGVAPDAKLLVGKVLDDYGSGSESGIIAAMEWAAAAKADVVNLSLGGDPTDGTDPMSQALNRISADTGTLFVVAAGNSGVESVGTPGSADLALTVGAVDRQDQLAEFSSQGPRAGDSAVKPDITAPGVDIVAARAARGWIGTPVGDQHAALSGTSMATPHVAGAAAILAGQHPDWTAAQLKSALMNSARPNNALTVYQQGAGRVDVARAVAQPVTAAPASLSLGTASWPHADDPAIVKTVTYRNEGPAARTLALTAAVTDPSGKPAVTGMAAVSPSSIVVPAGGEATATLTVTTSLDSPDGLYSGTLLASDGTVSVRTPIGFNKEVETVEIDLSFLGRNGAPTDWYEYRFVSHDRPKAYYGWDPSGRIVQRLPKGTYYYDATIQEGEYPKLTQIVEPAFTVTGNGVLVNDARDGTQPGFRLDKPNAKPGAAQLAFLLNTKWGVTGVIRDMRDFDGFLLRPAKTSAPGEFTYTASALLAEPDGNGKFLGTPYLYHLTHATPGTVPADLRPVISDRSLAVVHSQASSHGSPTATAERDTVARGKPPMRLTEYYTPNTPWWGSFTEFDGANPIPPATTQYSATPRSFAPGNHTEKWNAAVFGPAFPEIPSRPDQFAARRRDYMFLNVPMFTDQSSTHYGTSSTTSARSVLSRNGTVLSDTQYTGAFNGTVPSGPATYKFHAEATRTGLSELSTSVSADWTFSSDTVPGGDNAPLPLLAVRFAPSLDDHNRTEAGRPFTFPVYVQRNGSTDLSQLRKPAVQVSYDDGGTWQPVHLVRSRDQWLAVVAHPKDAKFVSLKAQAQDASGNTVDQTIIRAYGLNQR
jgi:subtilisin family serine protease